MLISLTCSPTFEDTKDRLILSLHKLSKVPLVMLSASDWDQPPQPRLAAIRSYVLPFERKLPESGTLTVLDGWHYTAHKSLNVAGLKFAEMVFTSRGDTSCDVSEMADTDSVASALLTEAAATAALAQGLREYPEYIGALRPRALLVGDRPSISDKYGKVSDLPFVPYSSNSGDFLFSNLPEYVFDHIGIVNGTPLAGESLHELWDTIGHPRVIALGRYAEDAVRRSKMPLDVALRHPQSVKRFAFEQGMEYGQAIAACAMDDWDGGQWARA